MALRVIWQYMDRSVTKQIVYGPMLLSSPKTLPTIVQSNHSYILHFTFLFSLFVFVSAAGQYNVMWTLKIPGQFKPTLAWIIFRGSALTVMSDDHANQPIYPLASQIFYLHTPQFNARDNSIVCFLYCVDGLK
jgi:hypothetical protein